MKTSLCRCATDTLILFQEFVNTTPARKYLEIRLARARLFILRSNRLIEDIATSCGFTATSHFITRYREIYSNTPQAERLAHHRTSR